MIRIIKFEAVHAEHLCLNAIDTFLDSQDKTIWRAWAKYNEKAGMAFTGLKNGVPIGAAGVRLVRPGIGNLWAVYAQDALRLPKELYRTTRTMLQLIIKHGQYRKLRCESRIGFDASQRLLEHLGFKRQRRNVNKSHYTYILRSG